MALTDEYLRRILAEALDDLLVGQAMEGLTNRGEVDRDGPMEPSESRSDICDRLYGLLAADKADSMAENELSQAQVIGEPRMKSWADYRDRCLSAFAGGYEGAEYRVRHGMNTVFNLLEAEFPPAEQCQAASVLLAACEGLIKSIEDARKCSPHQLIAVETAEAAIAKAKGE